MLKYEVVPGEIEVNVITTIVDKRRVKIIEVDLTSKYPGMIWYGHGGGQYTVYVSASEHSIKLDETRRDTPTEIRITGVRGDWWYVVADGSRYTVTIAMYRHREAPWWWRKLRVKWQTWRYRHLSDT